MKIVIISHPTFINSNSMPLFASMLADRFQAQAMWYPIPIFHRFPAPAAIRKWLGYIDQYLIFPFVLRWKTASVAPDTLFVFADQALGPWVPWLRHRPHVIHCHDLLALRSALGEISENPTGLPGRVYQRFIRWGFSKGRSFISVSNKTREDLHRLANLRTDESTVVYNGLNYPYHPIPKPERLARLRKFDLPVDERGMLLHVGGGQWYKNRVGVVEMYSAYVATTPDPLPLWMVGPKEQPEVLEAINRLPSAGRVHLLSGLEPQTLNSAYCHARLFLFPSLDEGFGWPIAEAQACGTPVLTTGEAPMTEVGGDAAFYHPRRRQENAQEWAVAGGALIAKILSLSAAEREAIVERGLANAARFDSEIALCSYEEVYSRVLTRAGVTL